MKKKILFFFLFIFLLVITLFVFALDSNFVLPTPVNGTITSATNFEINASISSSININEIKYNWNGTNYTIYDNSLLLMYNFDNVSALDESASKVVDVSLYGNNGTITSAILNSTNCKYGKCYTFNGNGSYIAPASAPAVSGNGNLTYSIWLKVNSYTTGNTSDGSGTYFIDRTTATSGLFGLKAVSGGQYGFQVRYDDNTGLGGPSGGTITGGWQHAVILREYNVNFRLYVDGINVANTTDTGSKTLTVPIAKLGCHATWENQSLDGNMDQFMIWNRTLSNSEIYELYVSNLNKFNSTQWYFYINQSNLNTGIYTYSVFEKDVLNNQNSTETRTIIVDTVYPSFSNYQDNSGRLNNSGTGVFNVTIENTNGTVFLEINNTNITATNLISNIYNASYYFSTNANYNYKWYSYGNGTNHNLNISSVRTFSVNYSLIVYPQINFIFPTLNNGTINASNSIQINISVSTNNGFNSFIYNWNGTNYTIYDNSLVLFMNMNNFSSLGESATVVKDLSIYGNNGTVTNSPVWNLSGKYDGSFWFNGGSDKRISVANAVSLRLIPNNFTIAAWIRPSGWGENNYGRIVDKATTSTGFSFYTNGANSGLGTTFYGYTSGGSAIGASTASVITLNVWQHAVLVFNNNTKVATFYVNGRNAGSPTAFTGAVADTTSALWIGNRPQDSARDFNGSIDEVMIWNRTLTASEIYQIYASNLQKYNSTQWYFYVNQSKNSTAGLDRSALYTYFATTKDVSNIENSTETRTIMVGMPLVYPSFSNYQDDSGFYTNVGTGNFNITVENTNTTVLLEINNINITASNLISNIYNASYYFSTGGTYSYKWYAYGNGTYNDINNSETRNYIVYISLPVFSNASNYSIDFKRGSNFTANITISNSNSSDTLSHYIFSSNTTGNWINDTPISITSSILYNASVSQIINLSTDETLCWQYFSNNSINAISVSQIYCFIVNSTAPTQDTPILNSTFGTNYTIENLTVYNQSTFDMNGDSIKNIISWYKNNAPIMTLNMPFEKNWITPAEYNPTNNITDYSGNQNTGNASNLTWNQNGGYDGKGAYDFNGTSIIQLPGKAFPGKGSYSIIMRFKPAENLDSSITTDRTLFRLSDSTSVNDVYFVFDSSGSGETQFTVPGALWLGNYGGGSVRSDSVNWTANTWYYVAATFDNSILGTGMRMYVNGILQANTSSNTYRNTAILSNKAAIGAHVNNIRNFNGTIDEVMVFNISLSSDEILLIYENKTNVMSSNEILEGSDVWYAGITPNDGKYDGITKYSNNITTRSIYCNSCTNCNNLISSAPSGSTVTLLNNIYKTIDCIKLQDKQNFTFDCNGNTIIGPSSGGGIILNYTNTSTIRNCNIYNFTDGVQMWYSYSNLVTSNNIINSSRHSIYTSYANNSIARSNNISSVMSSAQKYGLTIENSYNFSTIGNSIKDVREGIRYQQNSNYGLIDSNYVNNTYNQCIVTWTNNNILIQNNYVSYCAGKGVNLLTGNNHSIINNTIVNSVNAGTDGYGIGLSSTYNNIIINNTLLYNKYGIQFQYTAYNNIITGNRVSNSTLQGLVFDCSPSDKNGNNTFYNNIFNNTNIITLDNDCKQQYFNTTLTSGINIIGGSLIGGNFWTTPRASGYSDSCVDSLLDGICDIQYNLSGAWNIIDFLPLTKYNSPPNVFGVLPTTTYIDLDDGAIQLSVNATDDTFLDTVKANITYPNGTITTINFTNLVGSKFNTTFLPPIRGLYNITFIANDTVNNINSSVTKNIIFYSNSPEITWNYYNPYFYETNNITCINYTVSDDFLDKINLSIFNTNPFLTNYTTTILTNLTLYKCFDFTGQNYGIYNVSICAKDSFSDSPVMAFSLADEKTINKFTTVFTEAKTGIQFERIIEIYNSINRKEIDMKECDVKNTETINKKHVQSYFKCLFAPEDKVKMTFRCLKNCNGFEIRTDRNVNRIIDVDGNIYVSFLEDELKGRKVEYFNDKGTISVFITPTEKELEKPEEKIYIGNKDAYVSPKDKLNEVANELGEKIFIGDITGGLNRICSYRNIEFKQIPIFVSPTFSSGNYSKEFIIINVSVSSTELQNITVFLYNESKSLINSYLSTTTPFYLNVTVPYSGRYFINATAVDLQYSVDTETRDYYLDSTLPDITIYSPLNNDTYAYNYNVLYNFTVYDKYLDTFYWINATGNISYSTNIINEILPPGNYNLTFFANDTFGNSITKMISFSVNASALPLTETNRVAAAYYSITGSPQIPVTLNPVASFIGLTIFGKKITVGHILLIFFILLILALSIKYLNRKRLKKWESDLEQNF